MIEFDNCSQDTSMDYAESIGDYLTFYYTPLIVFVGSIGNILSIFVFFCTKLKRLSSSYYLAALGISDTCFLILSFVSWLNFQHINIIHRNYICQLYTFLQSVCSFMSVYIVVAFTVERFIAVQRPFKVFTKSICTVRQAVIILCCLVALGCIFSLPLIIFSGPVFNQSNNSTVCNVVINHKVSYILL